jgi:V/A-type H+-transporting ATPase subunit I
MMKAKQMFKLTIFGPKTFMKQIIEKMYDLDVVHIEGFSRKSDEEVFDLGEPFETNEKYAETLVKIRALITNLNLKKSDVKQSGQTFSQIEIKTDALAEQVNALLNKKEYLLNVKRVYDKKAVEKSLTALTLEENDHLNHYIGFINTKPELLTEDLNKISKNFELITGNYEGLNIIALFTEAKENVAELLENYDFSPVDNPIVKKHFRILKSKSAVKFVQLNSQVDLINKKIRKIDVKLNEIKLDNSKFLLESEKLLKVETDKAEAPLRFGTTKNSFVVRGWVPKENSKKLESELNKITNGKIMIKYEKPGRSDNVPIAFNHPKIVEPFEAFMDLYTLPTYKEIDPTFFMFLTFPIFFGFMLGDVGYGLVTLILFGILRMKMPSAKNILNAFIIASISAIIFGMVFGEYFGYEEVSPALGKALGIHPEEIVMHGEQETVYSIPRLFSRSTQTNDLISIAIIFGITHIFIGLIIGFINIYQDHGLRHAVMEKVGWMLLLPAIVWLLINFLHIMKGYLADIISMVLPPLPVLLIMAGAGVLMIIIGEGARGAVELPAILSNILSYARLMAVGLASLSLAVVINNMAGQMFKSGVIGIIAGIMVLVIGHTINIALGILSPFLHALRLHYVEFFTKFFQGGGKRYKSFGYSE